MESILLSIGAWTLTLKGVLLYGLFVVVFLTLYTFVKKALWKGFALESAVEKTALSSLRKSLLWAALLTFVILSLHILKLDYLFARGDNFDINLRLVFNALLVFQFARIIDWLAVHVFINKFYSKRDDKVEEKNPRIENTSSASQIVKYILYTIVGIVLIKQLHLAKFVQLYPVTLPSGDTIYFGLSDILSAVLVLLFARLILWVVTQIFLYGLYRRNKIDVGAQYSINQLLKYVVYVIAFFIALDRLGINMTLVWGGAAALLVGVGLGLQQTFNDFFSGIVLLFERSVSVGDSIEVNGSVATVKKIGLRSSELETRGNMTVIVPNSQIVNEKVINWNHYDERTRFSVSVGVAYGSDTQKIKKILLNIAEDSHYVIAYPAPSVRLSSFGDSSLDFELIFFSRNYIIIEDIKSDLRFEIDKRFREENIEIPFPQRVVHVQRDEDLNSNPQSTPQKPHLKNQNS